MPGRIVLPGRIILIDHAGTMHRALRGFVPLISIPIPTLSAGAACGDFDLDNFNFCVNPKNH